MSHAGRVLSGGCDPALRCVRSASVSAGIPERPWPAEVGLIKVKEALYEMGVPVAYMRKAESCTDLDTSAVHLEPASLSPSW